MDMSASAEMDVIIEVGEDARVERNSRLYHPPSSVSGASSCHSANSGPPPNSNASSCESASSLPFQLAAVWPESGATTPNAPPTSPLRANSPTPPAFMRESAGGVVERQKLLEITAAQARAAADAAAAAHEEAAREAEAAAREAEAAARDAEDAETEAADFAVAAAVARAAAGAENEPAAHAAKTAEAEQTAQAAAEADSEAAYQYSRAVETEATAQAAMVAEAEAAREAEVAAQRAAEAEAALEAFSTSMRASERASDDDDDDEAEEMKRLSRHLDSLQEMSRSTSLKTPKEMAEEVARAARSRAIHMSGEGEPLDPLTASVFQHSLTRSNSLNVGTAPLGGSAVQQPASADGRTRRWHGESLGGAHEADEQQAMSNVRDRLGRIRGERQQRQRAGQPQALAGGGAYQAQLDWMQRATVYGVGGPKPLSGAPKAADTPGASASHDWLAREEEKLAAERSEEEKLAEQSEKEKQLSKSSTVRERKASFDRRAVDAGVERKSSFERSSPRKVGEGGKASSFERRRAERQSSFDRRKARRTAEAAKKAALTQHEDDDPLDSMIKRLICEKNPRRRDDALLRRLVAEKQAMLRASGQLPPAETPETPGRFAAGAAPVAATPPASGTLLQRATSFGRRPAPSASSQPTPAELDQLSGRRLSDVATELVISPRCPPGLSKVSSTEPPRPCSPASSNSSDGHDWLDTINTIYD